MKSRMFLSLMPLVLLGGLSLANAEEDRGAVFVMTNAATDNQIVAYERTANGDLHQAGTFPTGGNGSGGTIDPLRSQGSVVLGWDHRFLFAVNAGSGSISAFSVHDANLDLLGTTASGGSMPTSIAQHGDLLYVLNAGGNGNIAGFHVYENGHLEPIAGSTRPLSNGAAGATSLTFSPTGRFLVVTEKATNNIDVFRVEEDGGLSAISVNASLDASPFAAVFTRDGKLIVASASNFVSSYTIAEDRTLQPVSASLPTEGMATCWNVITPNNRYTYTSDAASGTISGYSVGRDGKLTALPGTIVGTNPSGSVNIDAAMGGDGHYLYTLNAGTGTVSIFTVKRDGALEGPVTVEGLAAAAGIQGIAAY